MSDTTYWGQNIKYQDFIRILCKDGWIFINTEKHPTIIKPQTPKQKFIVPNPHTKEIDRILLMRTLKKLGYDKDSWNQTACKFYFNKT